MISRAARSSTTVRSRAKVEVLRASLSDALRMTIAREPLRLESGITGELEVGEADAVDEDLVGTNGGGGFESG